MNTLILLVAIGGFDFGGGSPKTANVDQVVYACLSKSCTPCKRFLSEKSQFEGVRFEIVYDLPDWVEGTPTFYWTTNGKRWKSVGYSGVKYLTWQINATQNLTEKRLSGNYPEGSRHWYIIGANNESRRVYISHLQSGQHAGKFDPEWLETLTLGQLRTLHDHDHENRVVWGKVDRQKQQVKRTHRQNYCPTCPR